MNTHIKNFIEENTDLIDSYQFEKLYEDINPFYRGSLSDVFITAGIDFLSYMEGIPEKCFHESAALTKLTIPRNIKQIGSDAFFHSSLTSILIPNSVTSIGIGAFYNCSSLTSITLPNSITSIGNYAFSNCSSLTSVTIPDSVTSIGNYAFYNCTSLASITIPDSVTSIGN